MDVGKMNSRIITAIVLKLFALWVAVSAVLAMPDVVGTALIMKREGIYDSLMVPMVLPVITLLIGFLLFRILWKLGRSVIDDAGSDKDTVWKADVDNLELMLFKLLGMYFVVSAITVLPGIIARFWMGDFELYDLTPEDYAWVFGVLVELAIGFGLIKKADYWSLATRSFNKNRN